MKIVLTFCLALALPLSAPAFAEEIQWKFKEGEQWTIEADQITELQWSSENSAGLSFKQSLVWKATVEQVSSEGIATLSQELKQAKLTVRSNRGEQNFDSLAPSASSSNSPYWESTRAQIGQLIRLQFRPTGEAVDSFTSKDSGNTTGATPVSYSALLAPSANPCSTPGLGIQFPSGQVQIGEPWTTRSKIHVGGAELLVDTTYQFVGEEKLDGRNLDKFKSSTGIRFAQPSADTKITKQDSEGTVWFDRQSGKVVRLESAQELMISDKDNPNQRLLQSVELRMAPTSTP